jgi:4'-phosphopantetheinyl transferase
MDHFATWTEPPPSPSLDSGTVHVWRIALDQEDDQLERFRRTLEPHELERAGRFHFEKHRRHFIVARGFLRSVVARYTNSQPEALRFVYGGYGKPALAGEHDLRFNLSHSNAVALLGVALNGAWSGRRTRSRRLRE